MSQLAPDPALPFESSDAHAPDDRREAAAHETQAQNAAPPEMRLFSEFRRKLATHEILSKTIEKLAQALRFSGRITLTFHQGRITKTTMKEAYYRGRGAEQG